ncbi:MAG: peptidase dimerization domain-containing protein [Halanaerobiales bacterium]
MNIAAGHRGLEWLEITIEGKAAHGGTANKGVNAISKAAKFINKVEEKLIPKFSERTHDLIAPPSLNFGVIKRGMQASSVAGECKIQIDSVVFGPGDISCVHSKIEYIDIEEAYLGYLIYSLVVIDFCEIN